MRSFLRADQVGRNIHRGVSDIMQQGLADPRLAMTTITGVKVSSDLGTAYVYYAVDGKAKSKKEAATGFKKAGGFIKRSLAKRLKMRYMPDLRFCYDESFDYGTKIDNILKNL